MNKQDFIESLNNVEGFKKFVKPVFLFFGRKAAQKSFDIYHTAEETSVLEPKLLARFEYEENKYLIIAYSTKGEIAPAKLDELKKQAEQIELGTVRYESVGFGGLMKYRGDWDYQPSKVGTIDSLGNPDKGLYVGAVVDAKKGFNKVPYVIYALKDGKRYFCAVPDYYLD